MLKRFSIAVEYDLLARFDALLTEEGYSNRSEAVRDLIRDALVKSEWDSEESITTGAVVLVYDHHKHDLVQKLTDIQHNGYHLIVASLHTHLDEHNCMEIIVTRGTVKQIRSLANRLISTRGVKHGKLVSSTIGKSI